MTAYRQYWVLTGLLLAGTIYVVYAGVISWALVKFPELQGQVISVFVFAVFLYAYIVHGYGATRLITANAEAIQVVADKQAFFPPTLLETEAVLTLAEARKLHVMGAAHKQANFSTLYDKSHERFENCLSAKIAQIDTIRVFLFFAGLLFTVVGIVQGFATLQFPTNAEEAKIYSSTIIKATVSC